MAGPSDLRRDPPTPGGQVTIWTDYYNTTLNQAEGRTRKQELLRAIDQAARDRQPVMSVLGGVPDTCLFTKRDTMRGHLDSLPVSVGVEWRVLELPGACWRDPAVERLCVVQRWG